MCAIIPDISKTAAAASVTVPEWNGDVNEFGDPFSGMFVIENEIKVYCKRTRGSTKSSMRTGRMGYSSPSAPPSGDLMTVVPSLPKPRIP